MRFRFVHIADVHLDTPFQNRDGELREVLGRCLRDTFSAAIDLTIERDAHALLIAGDLFDGDTLSYRTVKFLQDELRRLEERGIRVFYSPGNHDPAVRRKGSPCIEWTENVHIFSTSKPEVIPILDEDGKELAYVVGAGHEAHAEGRNLAKEFPEATGHIPYIGLLHCLLLEGEGASAHERYAPCTRQDLEEKGYSYWALGHVHSRVEYTSDSYIVYPGNICGRSFRETGLKGAYYVEVGGKDTIKTEFIPLSSALWIDMDIYELYDIENFTSLEVFLRDCLGKKIDKIKGDSKGEIDIILARLNLKGACPIYRELTQKEDMEVLEEDIGSDLGLEKLEIDTHSVHPPIRVQDYMEGPHLASYVLKLIAAARKDEELLLSLAADPVARVMGGRDRDELVKYLYGLLEDIEYEALTYLIEDDIYEI